MPEDDQHPPETARRRRRRPAFREKTLDKTVIAIPLLLRIRREERRRQQREAAGEPQPPPRTFAVIIDLNLAFKGERQGAKHKVERLVGQLAAEGHHAVLAKAKSDLTPQYVFAELSGAAVRELASRDNPRDQEPPAPRTVGEPALGGDAGAGPPDPADADRAVYRIWPDFVVRGHLTRSVSTVKADAARTAFAALGGGVVWAVVDSGIQKEHRHFRMHRNLELTPPLRHADFSAADGTEESALVDEAGHGTHVAGIVAGEVVAAWREGDPPERDDRPQAMSRYWHEKGGATYTIDRLASVSGVAPKCKLVSFKVLDKNGKGQASNILAAIAKIQEINGYGRHLLIHGVNLSVGYEFQPEWFACGQSPLCVEVDRLVRSGVVVVVSSGNTGYGFNTTKFEGTVAAGMDLSINDPGNAELAITVGSTHREMPHTYGVSYFSSKGPTGDGRLKPDLVAPGEKVMSCAAGAPQAKANEQARKALAAAAGDAGSAPNMSGAGGAGADAPGADPGCEYVEQSGTSMAAPHVSGVIAAFLSVRREFLGRPEAVKQIFTTTATDLRRDRYFQGAGLVDLMRAIQSV